MINRRKQVNSASGENQLENLQRKLNQFNAALSRERSMVAIEQEIPGARKGIPNEQTYNSYGNDAMEVEVKVLEKRDAFISVLRLGVPKRRSV